MILSMSMLELLFLSFSFSFSADIPFWKSKPDVYQKIIEERAVIVSVTHKNPTEKDGNYNLSFKAAGLVGVPLEFYKKKMQEYEKLPQISQYIKESKFDSTKNELYFWGEAYGFHAKMWMQILTSTVGEEFFLNWSVVRGHLTGMKGLIKAEDYRRQKIELSLIGTYDAKKLGMPMILLNFGLEIVLQQVANKIRNYLEAEYKKEQLSAK